MLIYARFFVKRPRVTSTCFLNKSLNFARLFTRLMPVFLQKKCPSLACLFFKNEPVWRITALFHHYLPWYPITCQIQGVFLIGSQKSVRIYKPAGTWSLFFNFSSTTFCFSAALIFFASPYSETDLNCSGAVPQLMKSLKRGIFHVEQKITAASFFRVHEQPKMTCTILYTSWALTGQ